MVVGLLQSLPLLRIRIQDAAPIQLLAMLQAGELDCVIGAFSRDMLAMPRTSELRVQPIVADRVCVVASRAHRWAGRKRISWTDAARERWTLPPADALMNKELSYALIQFGVEPIVPVIESMSALTTRWLMKYDDALLGMMREHQAQEEVSNGGLTILPVRPHIQLPDIALITPRRRLLDKATSDALQRALRRMDATASIGP
jgi:DNA-binding transcriptional LysR family regulator